MTTDLLLYDYIMCYLLVPLPHRTLYDGRKNIPHNQLSPTFDLKCSENSYCSLHYLCCNHALVQKSLRGPPGCQRMMMSSAPLCMKKQQRHQGILKATSVPIFHVLVLSTFSGLTLFYKKLKINYTQSVELTNHGHWPYLGTEPNAIMPGQRRRSERRQGN